LDAGVAVSAIFFTYAYPPARYPRAIQISRLVKYSRHPIRVICCEDGSARDYTIANPRPGKPAELHAVTRRPLRLPDPRWLIDRLPAPDGYRRWAREAAAATLGNGWIRPGEVLVTFGDPMSDHLAGLQIRRATGAPWIAHFSDPWVDNPYHRKSILTNRLNRKLEREVVATADRLVFTTRETIDLVMAKYPPAWRAKATAIPHAYDPELYGERPRERTGIVVRHVGNFYAPRSPQALIEALARLHKEQPDALANVRVELVGQIRPALDDRAAAALPSGLLKMRAPVDYLESLRLMQDADLLLVVDAPSEHSVFLPSKLIDYLGAGKPIMALSPPGASADLVVRLGGAAVRPDDAGAIAEKLAAAIAGLRKPHLLPWGDPGVRERYSAGRVVAEFDTVIDDLKRP
jgi:glycosyltransferase involved in cell wall biosynthesis